MRLLFFFCSLSSLYGIWVGNPGEPALIEKGIYFQNSLVSLRLGYLSDWVYQQRFQEEFLLAEKTRTNNELSTYAGLATLNFVKRLDLYGLLGASQSQIDSQIFTRREFAWGVGCKLIFLKHKNLFCAADVKYFETDQKPLFFVIEDLPYNVINNYTSRYFDVQAAVGFAYRISLFVPYINATYIYTHLSPEPPLVLIRFPDGDDVADLPLPSLISRKRWGMALGFSLIDIAKASLALEWRVFNQNAINVTGQIRF